MAEPFRVLLVEDDRDTQINIGDILELDGIQLTTVSTCREAESFADWENISVAILDRKLPDGSSDHLLTKIRQQAPHVDIVVITAYADLDSSINALRQGATDYLIKPVDPDQLRLRLSQIREHRLIEAKLRKENYFVEQLLHVAEAIVLVLDLDGTILRANAYLAAITEWPIEKIEGKNWFDHFLQKTDRQWLQDVFQKSLAKTKTRGIINRIVTRSGGTRDIRWSNSVLTDPQGHPTAVLAIGLDVTDLLAAQRRALQNERLAAIGQTMTALAHESRNALQRIQASVEMLRLDLRYQPEANAELTRIESAADDLQTLLEEIRTYAAPVTLDLQETALDVVWRDSWEEVRQAVQDKHNQLTEKLNGVCCRLPLDPARMRQVFRNLFQNAIEACADSVVVEIAARGAKIDGRPALEISIRDNGPGLNDEQRSGIFEAFYTTKSGGTGLGMAIAKRIIEVHQGTIEAANAASGGAEFKILLPTQRPSRSADESSG